MRLVLAVFAVLAAGCQKDACGGTCEPTAMCTVNSRGAASCSCPEGSSGTGVGPGSCTPVFSKLSINGVSLLPLRSLDVLVPAGTTVLDVEAETAAPGVSVSIDGTTATRLSVPFAPPLKLLDIKLGLRPPASLRVFVQPKLLPAVGPPTTPRAGFVAASTADRFVIGAAAFGATCRSGVVSTLDRGVGRWNLSTVFSDTQRCLGWTVSSSLDGKVIASSVASAAPPAVFRSVSGAWLEEPVDAPGYLSDQVVLQEDGSQLWSTGHSPDAGPGRFVGRFTPDAGSWQLAERVAPSGVALAVSSAGDRIAASGGTEANSVDLWARDGGNWVREGHFTGTGDFGSSVALSGDGTVLVASAKSARPVYAEIWELGAAGWQRRRTVTPPLGSPAPTAILFEVPVAVSRDGQTAAVGFPTDGTVVVLERNAGAWATRELVVGAGLTFEAFGSSVALGADGRRLAVTAPISNVAGVQLFEQAP